MSGRNKEAENFYRLQNPYSELCSLKHSPTEPQSTPAAHTPNDKAGFVIVFAVFTFWGFLLGLLAGWLFWR